MKIRCTLLLIPTLACLSVAQNISGQVPDMQARYDSAKAEFADYERKHGGFVQTKNINMHYLQWGDPTNTPLIWIHGSFTNGHELSDMAADITAKGYYLIAIDYYGHGLTKIPGHEVSLYHVADDIKVLMDSKNISKAVVGGWSRGGVIATAFYDSYPERVLGLVLEDGGSVATNTHYHHMEAAQLEARVKEIFRERVSYASYASEFEAYKAWYDYSAGGTQFKLLAWITTDTAGRWTIGPGIEDLFNMNGEAQFLDYILRPTKATLFGESMAIIEPAIVYRNLAVPMLLLDPVSATDAFPYEKENEALKNQHPHLITYKRYNETGHNIHYEQPARFVEDLGDFLQVVKAHRKK